MSAKKNILLVEDDRTHREFVGQILEKIGCRVVIAYDGEDALRLVMQHDFDAILMDIEMPIMDGIESARRLRDMKRHQDIADIPIIGISAEPEGNARELCTQAGMVDFIPKHMWKPSWEPNIREKLGRWL